MIYDNQNPRKDGTMRRYFLGMAAGYDRQQVLEHTFAVGQEQDCQDLKHFLEERYSGRAVLCKNGRSGLALALKAYFDRGDKIIVNGFTCYAVYEAIKAAHLTPVFTDINKNDLNYSVADLDKVVDSEVKGIIIQNSLGNPVDIVAIEKFAKRHNLTIIEDLAHCAGVKYPDGREVGTVGAATVLSFGKDKSIDTISGGAMIMRLPSIHSIVAPSRTPKFSDHLRARFYPLFGTVCRCLSYVNLGGALMRFLVKIHWVERSADNRLDLERKISKFEAKLALKRLKRLKKTGEPPIRDFYLVDDREETLQKLNKAGYRFSGIWYERPVSPERYYPKVHFPEDECPNAVYVAEHIINFPNYYDEKELRPARTLIQNHLVEDRCAE